MIGRLDTVTFTASDAINGSGVTYTLDPGGPLLSGLSIVGNTMTGATTAPEDTGSAVAIRATDNTDPTVFSVRLFSLKAIPAELYAWSSNPFTFTNAGKTGRYGPTITNLTDTYTPLWTNSANFLAIVTQGIQEWTVPMDGSYQIEAYGAAGGGSGNRNGYGARMRGTFSLTKGDVIKILVGQKGGVQNSGAGGGGTFVIRTPYDDTGSILVIAGGGGGQYNNTSARHNAHGTTSESGSTAQTNYNGGTSGGGGAGNTGSGASGGGGFTGTGGNGSYGTGGTPFTSGGVGGNHGSSTLCIGGFGGGGGTHGNTGGGGGGGGYSGGGGGWHDQSTGAGGGGGSYNSGTSQSNSAGDNSGHGYVIVEQL